MKSKIGSQFVRLFAVSLLFLVVTAMVIFQIQYTANQGVISSLAEKEISMLSKILQSSIGDFETLSMDILSNSIIQETNNKDQEVPRQFSDFADLSETFSSNFIFRPSLETILILFENGNTIINGKIHSIFDDSFLKAESESAKQQKGKLQIFPYPGDPDRIIFTRQIRKIKNLNHEHIATLFLVINLDGLIEETLFQFGMKDIQLILIQNGENFYSTDKNLNAEKIPELRQSFSGVEKIDKNYYFLSSAKLSNPDWNVVYLLPYNDIANLKNRLLLFSILVLLIVLTGLIIWGNKWSSYITKPITTLAETMRKMEASDFSDRNLKLPEYTRKDEIYTLYNDFQLLLQRVDFLINENYKKQLLLKETQLRNLIAQINPHFLYNTLDSINWLAQTNGQENISSMVQSLGVLLKPAIKMKNIIPLKDEIEILKAYLKIQKIRFQERLNYKLDEGLLKTEAKVPCMILQPIVENSIKYSLDIPKSSVDITISIRCLDEYIFLIIEDNGPGITESRIDEVLDPQFYGGIGLGNIRKRLKLFYGDSAEMEILPVINRGTKVSLMLPLTLTDGTYEEI